ncbi:MAG: hypothetical protein ABI415_05670 [Flavitalea sp.]
MRNIRNLSRIKSIIRHSGITVKNAPSMDHPIPVAVFYLNKSDGTVGGFWPKGNRETALSSFYSRGSRIVKWTFGVYSLCLALGLERLLADGKLVLYTDLPTATYLQHQWRN